MRSKLEAKGDLVLAQPGATVTMETNTLRLQARIVDMQYGTGPLPPNSYFEKMTIELAAWRKEPGAAVRRARRADADAAGRPATAGDSAAPQQAPVQTPAYQPPPAPEPTYQPPAQQPSYSRPRSSPRRTAEHQPPPISRPSGTQRRLQPTPAPLRPAVPNAAARPRPNPDDDPFGGTGDFTPIS